MKTETLLAIPKYYLWLTSLKVLYVECPTFRLWMPRVACYRSVGCSVPSEPVILTSQRIQRL